MVSSVSDTDSAAAPQWLLGAFVRTCTALEAAVTPPEMQAVAEFLLSRWNQFGARQHNARTLAKLLQNLDLLAETMHFPHAARLALWLQGAFDPNVLHDYGAPTTLPPAVAASAQQVLAQLQLPDAKVQLVMDLLSSLYRCPEAVAAENAQSGEKGEPTNANSHENYSDKAALCDALLSVLALNPQSYRAYTEGLREDATPTLGQAQYLFAREAYVDKLLARRSIFISPLARAWEPAARQNLQAEKDRLVALKNMPAPADAQVARGTDAQAVRSTDAQAARSTEPASAARSTNAQAARSTEPQAARSTEPASAAPAQQPLSATPAPSLGDEAELAAKTEDQPSPAEAPNTTEARETNGVPVPKRVSIMHAQAAALLSPESEYATNFVNHTGTGVIPVIAPRVATPANGNHMVAAPSAASALSAPVSALSAPAPSADSATTITGENNTVRVGEDASLWEGVDAQLAAQAQVNSAELPLGKPLPGAKNLPLPEHTPPQVQAVLPTAATPEMPGSDYHRQRQTHLAASAPSPSTSSSSPVAAPELYDDDDVLSTSTLEACVFEPTPAPLTLSEEEERLAKRVEVSRATRARVDERQHDTTGSLTAVNADKESVTKLPGHSLPELTEAEENSDDSLHGLEVEPNEPR